MDDLQFRNYLSIKQREVLDILICLGSSLEAAERVGLDEQAVIQWMKTDKWFIAALKQEKKPADIP